MTPLPSERRNELSHQTDPIEDVKTLARTRVGQAQMLPSKARLSSVLGDIPVLMISHYLIADHKRAKKVAVK